MDQAASLARKLNDYLFDPARDSIVLRDQFGSTVLIVAGVPLLTIGIMLALRWWRRVVHHGARGLVVVTSSGFGPRSDLYRWLRSRGQYRRHVPLSRAVSHAFQPGLIASSLLVSCAPLSLEAADGNSRFKLIALRQ